jgi:hypothetical protein
MQKIAVFATIAGLSLLVVDLVFRWLAGSSVMLWLPGVALAAFGVIVRLTKRDAAAVNVIAPPRSDSVNQGLDTARLLDNFEQRFAELKSRRTDALTLSQLFELGAELERRKRLPQATAVYRYVARIDNTYRDVGTRLRKLVDAERETAAALAAATAIATPSAAPATIKAPPGGAADWAATCSSARLAEARWALCILAGTPPSIAWWRSKPFRLAPNSVKQK